MTYSLRGVRERRFDPHSDVRITEDGIPNHRERCMALLRAGTRNELNRLAGCLVPQDGETEEAFRERCDRAVDHQCDPVYLPEPAEIAEIFERAARARERLAQPQPVEPAEEEVESSFVRRTDERSRKSRVPLESETEDDSPS